jgi:arylsulfatase A-like enzyme
VGPSGDRDSDKAALRARVTPAVLQSLVDQYDVAIRYSMEQIAGMLWHLGQQGLLENTAVILTSDHGEELFDHGGFSHGYTLCREVLHVPLYVHLPGQREPASDDRLVSIVDVLPTVLDLVGVEPMGAIDGVSLLTSADEGSEDRVLIQQTVWSRRSEGISAIRGSQHRIDLVKSYDPAVEKLSLYDLSTDRLGRNDLAPTRNDLVVSLGRALERRVASLEGERHLAAPENVVEKMDEEMLRALGYVE